MGGYGGYWASGHHGGVVAFGGDLCLVGGVGSPAAFWAFFDLVLGAEYQHFAVVVLALVVLGGFYVGYVGVYYVA